VDKVEGSEGSITSDETIWCTSMAMVECRRDRGTRLMTMIGLPGIKEMILAICESLEE